MLGFLNLPLGHYYLCVLPSLAVEWTGIAHITYPLRNLMVRLLKLPKQVEDAEESEKLAPRNLLAAAFYWARCVMSALIMLLSTIMVVLSLFAVDPESYDWPSLGVGAAIAILIALLLVLSVFAGLQVSLVELFRTPVCSTSVGSYCVSLSLSLPCLCARLCARLCAHRYARVCALPPSLPLSLSRARVYLPLFWPSLKTFLFSFAKVL